MSEHATTVVTATPPHTTKQTAQIECLAYANAEVREGNLDEAREWYAKAGVPVTPEIELTWATEAYQRRQYAVARACYARIYNAAANPASEIARAADAGVRRCLVGDGDLKGLQQWLTRPNWKDLQRHRSVRARSEKPTPDELRAIARNLINATSPDWALIRHIARETRDRSITERAYRTAVHHGDWRMVEELAADLGRAPSRKDHLAVARELIRASSMSIRDRDLAVTYLVTHGLRALAWHALLDGAEWQGWNRIRARAKRLHFRITERHLNALLGEFMGYGIAREHIAVLAELARRHPKRWRSSLHSAHHEYRRAAVAHGEVPHAAWIASRMRRPLTVAECTNLLAHNRPKDSDPPYRYEYRKQLVALLRDAATCEAAKSRSTRTVAPAASAA